MYVTAASKVTKKDSSSSESSDDSDDKPAATAKKAIAQVSKTNGKTTANGKSSSSEEDDSSDSDKKVASTKTSALANKSSNKSTVAKAAKASSSSSESSDSDSNDKKLMAQTPSRLLPPTKTSTPNNFKPVKFVSSGFSKPTIQQPTKSSSDDDSSEESDNKGQTPVQNKNSSTKAVAGKKRKLSENGDLPLAKKAANNTNKSFNNGSNSKPNTPFRRVKTEEVDVDTRLANNSFDAKVNYK